MAEEPSGVAGGPASVPRRSASTGTHGVLLAVAAYLLWGFFPFYFLLVRAAAPVEVVAHRVLWSFVFCLVGAALWRQLPQVRAIFADRKLFGRLAVAGTLVSANWLVYVWGVLNDHVVDASLGYFINPLFTVTLAVVLLRERLRPVQWAAVGIGLVAVLVIAFGYGQVPWVALALAFSFGLYSYLKNRVGERVSPLVGLTIETTALTPIALGYLGWLQIAGDGTFFNHGTGHTVSLLSAGIVTAAPLLLFAGAASRIPLSLLGLVQYLTPVMQFGFGVWINHEVMPLPRWIGFGLVWVALILLSVDSVRAARRRVQQHSLLIEPEIQD